MLKVVVRGENISDIEQSLRFLKRKLQREKVFRELKVKRFYEKPSEKKLRKKEEALKRLIKAAQLRRQQQQQNSSS